MLKNKPIGTVLLVIAGAVLAMFFVIKSWLYYDHQFDICIELEKAGGCMLYNSLQMTSAMVGIVVIIAASAAIHHHWNNGKTALTG